MEQTSDCSAPPLPIGSKNRSFSHILFVFSFDNMTQIHFCLFLTMFHQICQTLHLNTVLRVWRICFSSLVSPLYCQKLVGKQQMARNFCVKWGHNNISTDQRGQTEAAQRGRWTSSAWAQKEQQKVRNLRLSDAVGECSCPDPWTWLLVFPGLEWTRREWTGDGGRKWEIPAERKSTAKLPGWHAHPRTHAYIYVQGGLAEVRRLSQLRPLL